MDGSGHLRAEIQKNILKVLCGVGTEHFIKYEVLH